MKNYPKLPIDFIFDGLELASATNVHYASCEDVDKLFEQKEQEIHNQAQTIALLNSHLHALLSAEFREKLFQSISNIEGELSDGYHFYSDNWEDVIKGAINQVFQTLPIVQPGNQ